MTQEELEIFIKTRLAEAGGVSQAEAARRMKMNRAKFNRKIKYGPLEYLEAVELARVLGYEIKWIKTKKDKTGEQDSGNK